MKRGIHIDEISTLLVAIAAFVTIAGGAERASAGIITIGCTDCPLRIPELGTRGSMVSELDVDVWGRISDLDVFIDVTHTFTGDLEIIVRSPNGNEVLLFDNFGFSGNDIAAVTFDDEAAPPINHAQPPFGPGRFRPVPGLLADFDGTELHGSWTLRIVDRFLGDTGMLVDWELTAVTVSEPSTLTLLLLVGGWGIIRRRRRSRSSRSSSVVFSNSDVRGARTS